jgi:hypothetical protein
MNSTIKFTAGSASTRAAVGTARAAEVYTVAPGYHVSFLAGAADVAMQFDLIEVVTAHRGGPAHNAIPARRGFTSSKASCRSWRERAMGCVRHLCSRPARRMRFRPACRMRPGQRR